MGIMDNEGHDPQGLGNVLRHSDANDLRWSKTEIALRDDIIRSRDHDIAQLQAALRKAREALTEAREALATIDHPHGAERSCLTLIRGGREIGTIIDAALGSTVEQSVGEKP